MERFLVSKLKVWTKFTPIKRKKDKQLKDHKRSIYINVNEEYQGALKSKSFTDFFLRAQSLVHDQSLSTIQSYSHHKVLLEPKQETIDKVLESKTMSKGYEMKEHILEYFDISSEASNICANLLKSIIQIQFTHTSIQQSQDTIVEDYPISNIRKQDFEMICTKNSSVLQKMKVMRKNVSRKIKMINCFNKATEICVTVACSVVAVVAIALAAHTLTALVAGPVIFSLPLKTLKKLGNFQFLKSGYLRRIREKLDVAMKGTYILNRDFDTISRLVNHLNDEIERNQKIVKLCLEMGRDEDKICVQVLREIEKNNAWFRKQVEELEEHLYLCLLTINKARGLVIKELLKC